MQLRNEEFAAETAEESGNRLAARQPHEPTKREREEHMQIHEPYCDWFPSCVSRRGRAERHTTRDKSGDAVHAASVDYGFFTGKFADSDVAETDEQGNPVNPVLCGRFSGDRWLVGFMCPTKGVEHPYIADTLCDEVRAAGQFRLFARSDNEPAMKALVSKAAFLSKTLDAIDLVPDPVRTRDSNANGAAELAVREVKAKTRVIKSDREERLSITIDALHWCLPFLVLHAVASINRGRRGPDGKTAFELRYG